MLEQLPGKVAFAQAARPSALGKVGVRLDVSRLVTLVLGLLKRIAASDIPDVMFGCEDHVNSSIEFEVLQRWRDIFQLCTHNSELRLMDSLQST